MQGSLGKKYLHAGCHSPFIKRAGCENIPSNVNPNVPAK